MQRSYCQEYHRFRGFKSIKVSRTHSLFCRNIPKTGVGEEWTRWSPETPANLQLFYDSLIISLQVVGMQLWYTTSYGTALCPVTATWMAAHIPNPRYLPFHLHLLEKTPKSASCNLRWHFLNFSYLLYSCYCGINGKLIGAASLGFLCSVESMNTKGLAAALLHSCYHMKQQNMHCNMSWNSGNLVFLSWVMPEPLNLLGFLSQELPTARLQIP